MLEINGAEGEGGGSIIRLACAFSAVTKKPFRIINIRAKRANPGLQAQHLTSVKAVAEFCNAKIIGAELGSTELEFYPGELTSGNFSFNIGTAGSISLVLQALMIPSVHCDCKVEITGGTDVKFAPPIEYLQSVTLPVLKKYGYKGRIDLIRHGFYPKGDGFVKAEFNKSELSEISILKRGKPINVEGSVIVSKDLENKKVAERIEKYAHDHLLKALNIMPKITKDYVSSLSKGGCINLNIIYEKSILGSNNLLEKDKSSDKVARECVNTMLEEDNLKVPVDQYLEDQLIPYLALFGGQIKVHSLTNHTKTNIWLAEQFLPVKFSIENNVIKCIRN